MRLEKPRVSPLDEDEIDPELKSRFRDGPVLNIFRTLARHPKLLKRWLVFGNHVLSKSSLPERERELVIIRIGWLCQAEYEWAQHVVIGLRCGLSQEEIDRISDGPDAPGWSDLDRALLRATDELHANAFIADATWASLSERYGTEQLMDLIFTVGQYNLVSMALNSLGVQLEPGQSGFPSR
jgi:alkylhydroperoxidase family enzyme